tara:strand:- start:3970 stop:4575 length:606 start_codon:yes stop_codon:yes gene_type:complete
MKQLKDYVRTYDNVIDGKFAKELINIFENNPSFHDRVERNTTPKFTQLNLTELSRENGDYSDVHQKLQNSFLKFINIYKTECSLTFELPEKLALEEFRIKKYNPWKQRDEPCDTCVQDKKPDQFSEHIDVGDYNSARRYLAFFLYLNKPNGGETVFTKWHQYIKPEAGRLLMFPPTWQYPHKGNPCTVRAKYIIGSYLHYL